MSVPSVRFLTASGTACWALPGAIVGRMASAAVYLDDPRVSEAHALLSLRGARLWLLQLRGALSLGGAPPGDVALEERMVVELAPGVTLSVERLRLPEVLPALAGLGARPVPLSAMEMAVVGGRLVEGHPPNADLWFWAEEDAWRQAAPGSPPRPLDADFRHVLPDGRYLRLESIPIGNAASAATVEARRGGCLFRVRSVTTEILLDGEEVAATLESTRHGLFSELAYAARDGTPVSQRRLAAFLWKGKDFQQQHQNFYKAVRRLRQSLARLGLDPAMIGASGDGEYTLELPPGCRVELPEDRER